MNKEIFKLEELLKENGIPFFFNYREENRPTPFGTVPVEMSNEELCIEVGTPAGDNISAHAAGESDEELLDIINIANETHYENITADIAFALIKGEFLRSRATWWPEVYGNEK